MSLLFHPVQCVHFGLELGVNIRSFQDIKVRLPKLFNENCVVKIIEFQ